MSKADTELDTHSCAAIDQLIPWFVNGTLSTLENARVSRHLQDCHTCQQALTLSEMIHASATDTHSGANTQGLSMRSFDELATRVDQYETTITPATPTTDNLPRFRRDFFIRHHIPQRVITGMAICVVLFISVLFAPESDFSNQMLGANQSPIYQTLTDTPGTALPPDSTTDNAYRYYRVLFQKDTPQHRVDTLIQGINATVISGPTPRGVYTLRLTAQETLLPQLRATPDILVAESVTP